MRCYALKTSFITSLTVAVGLLASSCETQVKNNRNSVAKDYGTIPDILEYASAKSSSKGMSVNGASAVESCLSNSSLADSEDKRVSAATAIENMAAALDKGLACAIEKKIGAEDMGSFYNLIVSYFALLPRTRLETMNSMQTFSDILVKYLAMLDDSEIITEILEKTISDNLSSYNDAGAGITYADIAASISETAGSAFKSESISSAQATSILSSLGTAAGNLAVTAKEKPADGADVFSDILAAYFAGVGNVTASNFSDVSTMANALAEKYSASYGASLGASDAASFLSESNSEVSSLLADMVASGQISSADSATLNSSIQDSIASGLNDTFPPVSGASISVASGAGGYTSGVVHLTLSAANATEVFIATNASCTNGEWQDYDSADTSVDYTFPLVQASGTYSLYAKFRNEIGAESTCVSAGASVTLDRTVPLTPSLDISLQNFTAAFDVVASPTDTNFLEFRYTITGTAPANCSAGSASSGTINISGTNDVILNVIECDRAGNASAAAVTGTYTYTGAPSATPSITSIDTISTTGLTIHWDPTTVNHETGFVIMRALYSSGCGAFSATVADINDNANGTTYANDSGLSIGTPYCYQIKAKGTNADSSYSASAYAVTAMSAAPTLASTTSSVTVSWTSVASVSYIVYQSDSNTTITTGNTTPISGYKTTSYSGSSVTPGTTYYYALLPDIDGVTPVYNAITATSTIQLKAADPAISPAAGNYGSAQTVTITSATSGATICYTTDGSTPACSAARCTSGTTDSAGLSQSVAATVSESACKSGYGNSSEGSNAYTFGTTWVQQAYIKASNGEAGDNFGYHTSISGDTLAVGAVGEASSETTITNGTISSSDNGLSGSGAVYVYARTGTNWEQQAYIKAANNGSTMDYFSVVAIDTDTLVVGAFLEDSNLTTITNGTTASSNNSITDSGAVYIYKRTGVNWQQEAYVKASNAGGADEFGYSVAISGDTVAIAAPAEDSNQTTITNGTASSADNSSISSGAVFIYKRTGTNWAQEAYLKAVNNGSYDSYGWAMAISGDTLVVGAWKEDSNDTTITNATTASADGGLANAGAVYVYKRTGSNWAQEAFIKAKNAAAADLNFGQAVAISSDTIVVSAVNDDSNQTTITNGTTASANTSATDSGAVFVYTRSGTTWTQQAYIKAANAATTDGFGASVTISTDTIAVGAPYEDSNLTTITNGTTASSNNTSADSGAVYIYKRTGSNWAQEAYVKTANSQAGDWVGYNWSMSMNVDTLAVGVWAEDSNQTTITNGTTASANNSAAESGAVYVYTRQ